MIKVRSSKVKEVLMVDGQKRSFGEHKLFFNLNKEYLLTSFHIEDVHNWWNHIFDNALQDKDYRWFVLQGLAKLSHHQLSTLPHKILYMYMCPEKAFEVWSDIKSELSYSSETVIKEVVHVIKNLYHEEQHAFLVKEIMGLTNTQESFHF